MSKSTQDRNADFSCLLLSSIQPQILTQTNLKPLPCVGMQPTALETSALVGQQEVALVGPQIQLLLQSRRELRKQEAFSFGGATSTAAAPISNVPAECPAEMQVGENQHFTNALSSTKVSTIVEVGRASDAGSKKSERVVERVVLGPKVLHPQSVPKAAPLKASPLVVAMAPVPVTGIVEGVNLLLNSDSSSLASWQLHVYAHLKSEPANVSASGLESQLILVRSVTLKTMKLKSSNGRCTFVPLSEPISVERGHFLGVCNSNSSSALRVAASTKVASTNEEQEGDRLPAGKGGVLDFKYGGSTSFPAGEGGTVVVTPLVGCQLALNFVFRPICEGKGAEGTSTSTDYGLASNFETG